MFIISIYGGLGSQMDQYAFYLAVKKAYPDSEVKVEVHNLIKPDHNGYELQEVFGLTPPSASIKEICIYSDIYPVTGKLPKIGRFLTSLRRVFFGRKNSFIVPDDPTAFYPNVFQLNPLYSFIFFGNWNNELYTRNVEQEIMDAFKFPPLNDWKNERIAQEIRSLESVSIHVRHGDYQKFGFPLLSINYYKSAVKLISEKIKNPFFYVFSDDVEFVKQQFDFLENYTIVDWNSGRESYRDMQLMSMCKHNIVANSTFSYWGARLNANVDKIVIAPKIHSYSCKYPLACQSWITIDN